MFGFGRGDRSPVNPVKLYRDAAGQPAVNLTKLREGGHINLAKAADEAGAALAKRNLSGIRAQACALLDHSRSMKGDYMSGAVQRLVERVLGFALQIDADGVVPVLAFDTIVHPEVKVSTGNYQHVVDQQIWRPARMGTTNLAEALEAVRKMAAYTAAPLYAAVITDGEPDNARNATKVACELARYPVFLKFIALRPVGYLASLDKLGEADRLLDNCNAQPAVDSGLDLLTCTDAQFQEAMADEWDTWIDRALAKGVLTR